MNKFFIVSLLCVLFSFSFAMAAPKDDCNTNGGIWCGADVNNGECVLSSSNPLAPSVLPSCHVQVGQDVFVNEDVYFHFDELTVTAGIGIRQNNPSAAQKGADNACVSGADRQGPYSTQGGSSDEGRGGGAKKGDSGKGGGGGAGGAGGAIGEAGGRGGYGGGWDDNDGRSWNDLKAAGPKKVSFFINKLVMNDIGVFTSSFYLSGVDGDSSPTPPPDNEGADDDTNCEGDSPIGEGGSGGQGGSGAGHAVFTIYEQFEYTGSHSAPLFRADGGDGGNGGRPGKDTGSGGPDGCPGAGGGGGAGGIIEWYSDEANRPLDSQFSTNGGAKGVKGANNQCDSYNDPIYDQVQDGLDGYHTFFDLATETLCNDGIDNDGDSFVDMEDHDCISLGDFDVIELLSVGDPGTKASNIGLSWWNPSAFDGSDGVCGDEVSSGIILSDAMNDNQNSWNFFSTGGFEDGYMKMPFGGGASVTLPFTKHGEEITIDLIEHADHAHGYVGVYFIDSSQGATAVLLSDLSYSTTCDIAPYINTNNYYRLDVTSGTPCTFQVNSPEIDQIFIFYSVAVNNMEGWADSLFVGGIISDSEDLGHVLEPIGFAQEMKYICLSDYDANDGGIIYSANNQAGDWRWYDASSSLSSEFAAHKLNGFDIISNTEEWFYCDAYDASSSGNGLGPSPVPNFGSFSDPTAQFSNLCVDIPGDFGLIDAQNSAGDVVSVSNYVFYSACSASVTKDDLANVVNGFGNVFDLGGNAFGSDNPFMGCCDSGAALNPLLGYELFTQGNSAGSCPSACFNVNGDQTVPIDPNVGTTPGSSSTQTGVGNIVKGGFNPASSSYTYSTATCELYAINEFGTNDIDLCNTNEYCVGDDASFAYTTSSGGDLEFCCVQGTCEEPAELSCSEIGLQMGVDLIKEYDPAQSSFVCLGNVFTDTFGLPSGWECCVGPYTHDNSQVLTSPSVSDSFMCYRGSEDRSLFGECCGGTKCFNEPYINHNLARGLIDSGSVFGEGTALHTIASFDELDDITYGVNDLLREYVIAYPDPSDLPLILDDGVSEGIILDEVWSDWSRYDRLTFDLYWDGPLVPIALHVGFRDLNTASDPAYVDKMTFDASTRIHPQFRSQFWHRITLDLPASIKNSAAAINYLSFEFNSSGIGASGNSLMYVDNFVLESDDPQLDSHYCSGPSRMWFDDFTLPNNPSFEEIEAVQRICDAQLSFKWTGNHCCGSASELSDPSQKGLGEYYSDDLMGCWGGLAVLDNSRVSDAYDDAGREPHVLYYEKEYYSCIEDIQPFTDIRGQVLDVNVKDQFSIVGDWYCDAFEDYSLWRPVSEMPRTKILFTKMQDLSDGRDFTLHCDELGQDNDRLLAVYNPLGTSLTQLADPSYSDRVCVLNAIDSDGETDEVIIGLPLLEEKDVNQFVLNLKTFYPFEDSAEQIDCSVYEDENGDIVAMPSDVQDPADFFLQCVGSGFSDFVDVDVFYNKPLHIVYFSFAPISGDGGFFGSIWNALLNLFSNLFGGDDTTAQTINLDVFFEADFKHAYLAKQGDLFVKGVMERIGDPVLSEPYDDINYERQVRVDFVKFSSDLRNMRDLILSDDVLTYDDVSYCSYDDVQSFYIDLAPGVFFDWRYITSNLDVSDDGGIPFLGPSDASCLLHNGEIDLGEECDDTYLQWEEIVVLGENESLDCSHYDPTWAGSINRCIDGTLDKSTCISNTDFVLFGTSQSYKGDFGGSDPDTACVIAATNGGFVHATSAKALISRSYQDAIDVLPDNVAIYSVSGQLIANQKYELFSSDGGVFGHMYDEFGAYFNHGVVWTGTNGEGRLATCTGIAQNCADWTTSENSLGCSISTGVYGDPLDAGIDKWVDDDNTAQRSCAWEHHVYCVVPKE